MGPRPCFCFTPPFTQNLNQDSYRLTIKSSWVAVLVLLQLALHYQPQNAEAAEVKVAYHSKRQASSSQLGCHWKTPCFNQKKMKLCWGQLGSSAQGMKNHWTSFSAAKKGSHWTFSHGIKTSVYMVFGLRWKKNNVFFGGPPKIFRDFKNISQSSPVRSDVDRTTFDVTWPSATRRAWLWRFPLGFVTFKRSAGG